MKRLSTFSDREEFIRKFCCSPLRGTFGWRDLGSNFPHMVDDGYPCTSNESQNRRCHMKLRKCWPFGTAYLRCVGVVFDKIQSHVHWAGLLVCRYGRRGAHAAHETTTAFPSLVRHLDHVTPASHAPPGCPSRTSDIDGCLLTIQRRYGKAVKLFQCCIEVYYVAALVRRPRRWLGGLVQGLGPLLSIPPPPPFLLRLQGKIPPAKFWQGAGLFSTSRLYPEGSSPQCPPSSVRPTSAHCAAGRPPMNFQHEPACGNTVNMVTGWGNTLAPLVCAPSDIGPANMVAMDGNVYSCITPTQKSPKYLRSKTLGCPGTCDGRLVDAATVDLGAGWSASEAPRKLWERFPVGAEGRQRNAIVAWGPCGDNGVPMFPCVCRGGGGGPTPRIRAASSQTLPSRSCHVRQSRLTPDCACVTETGRHLPLTLPSHSLAAAGDGLQPPAGVAGNKYNWREPARYGMQERLLAMCGRSQPRDFRVGHARVGLGTGRPRRRSSSEDLARDSSWLPAGRIFTPGRRRPAAQAGPRGVVGVRPLASYRGGIFTIRSLAGRCRWSAGFLGDLQFPPGAVPYSLRFSLIGSQDLHGECVLRSWHSYSKPYSFYFDPWRRCAVGGLTHAEQSVLTFTKQRVR
ncbi:hypothetical protein PR048_030842 [Dryococelus australis]|uniref:Uncharacterized protein n=1 Tax=Dryococelus australis TaxID=614101 RepID=A0ABQ9GA23_9NEOP|nr:hypothetical protein PR048_030842 [Dryococelus australis]